ncbi:hypothetical protein O1611_g3730 [Lasiodiplodia mahajangana]|uniref:Uncharacterized protein n=1 Tax=Lasiodiplodia mahajangana TaxID=1108764 RepID=A0ACC2JR79_9PEZI|nr:hypothetical protein O1611_g3730 [Lasiodiplodia mahajangana]
MVRDVEATKKAKRQETYGASTLRRESQTTYRHSFREQERRSTKTFTAGQEEDLDILPKESEGHPACSFVALTSDGQEAWPNFNGTLTSAQFQDMTAFHPELITATGTARPGSQPTAGRGGSSGEAQQGRIRPLGSRARGVKKRQQLSQGRDRGSGSGGGRGRVAPARVTPLAPPIQPNNNRQEQEGTPATTYTEGGTRTAKVEHPPIFTNDKPKPGKPEVGFQHWFMLLKNKLNKNSDYWDNDSKRIAYIASQMGGSASNNIVAFIINNHGGAPIITTSDKLLEHLET